MRPIRIPVLLIALLSSLATSSINNAFEGIEAFAIVHNGGSEEVQIEVEVAGALLDCDLLRDHPELYADIPWAPPIEVPLAPGSNYGPSPINPGDTLSCTAARVTIGQNEPVVMFNHIRDFPVRQFPLTYSSLSEVDPAVLVIVEGSNQVLRPTSSDFVFEEPEPLEICDSTASLSSISRASGEVMVLSSRMDRGCTILDLLTETDSVEELELCIDPALIPWEEGDSLSLSGGPTSLLLSGKFSQLRVLIDPEVLPFGLFILPDRLTRFECMGTDPGRFITVASEVHLVGAEIDHGVARVGEILSVQLDERTDADIWLNRYDASILASTRSSVQLAILSWER